MKNTTKASISRVKAEVVCPDDHNKGCSTTQADVFKSTRSSSTYHKITTLNSIPMLNIIFTMV